MGTVTKTTTWSTGDTLTAANLNSGFDDIVDEFNGSIANVNVSATAAIAATKISDTAVTLTATQTLTNKTLTSPAVNTPTMTGTVATLTTATDGATVTFNLNNGPIHTVTLGGNRTLALSNDATGKVFIIRLIQDGTGSRTVTWFSTIDWAGGSAPTLTTTAAAIDVFGFITTASSVYDGVVIGLALS